MGNFLSFRGCVGCFSFSPLLDVSASISQMTPDSAIQSLTNYCMALKCTQDLILMPFNTVSYRFYKYQRENMELKYLSHSHPITTRQKQGSTIDPVVLCPLLLTLPLDGIWQVFHTHTFFWPPAENRMLKKYGSLVHH